MTHSRPYRDADDITRLQQYNAVQSAHDARGWLHPGDIPHRLFNGGRRHNPSDLLRLWEDDAGDIIGWAMLSLPNRFDIQSHDIAVMDEALAWVKTSIKVETIETDLWAGDSSREDIYRQHGFIPAPDALPYAVTFRALDDLPPGPLLPVGFSIRTAAGVHEAEALAAVHAASFGSKWTVEQYTAVMESPGYAAEREFVVVAPDGRFAAFTVTWHDVLNRLGYFEPVGTHADFRRMGLARAMMLHAMHVMREAGMTQACVAHEPAEENPASAALYASLGFARRYSTRAWVKHRV
jgi:ribosomal protein S18 acetylase RimI-like enzyme